MARDDVLELEQEIFREAGDRIGLFFHHEESDSNMSDQLPLVCVAEIFAKGELFAFSDVVKDAAGQQEVEVELPVAAGYASGKLTEGECMFEKSADVGMVKALSRWAMAQGEEEIVVPEEGLEQTLQVLVSHRMNDAL